MSNKLSPKIQRYLENVPEAPWAAANLLGAHTTGFYGKITIQFEAGRIVLLRKEQTQKPPKNLREKEDGETNVVVGNCNG